MRKSVQTSQGLPIAKPFVLGTTERFSDRGGVIQPYSASQQAYCEVIGTLDVGTVDVENAKSWGGGMGEGELCVHQAVCSWCLEGGANEGRAVPV